MNTLIINEREVTVTAALDTPLLWVIRDHLKLTGTKFGCGAGLCGACTVLLDGQAVFSCQTLLTHALNRKITTIEGLSEDNSHPVQKAWIEEQVPQCGYCQSGQIMRATGLLLANTSPSEEDIVNGMYPNLCRCSTYNRVIQAVKRAAKEMKDA